MSARDLLADMESTVNKFQRFYQTDLLKAMLGHRGRSLDMGQAIDSGALILVSLAQRGGKASANTAKVLGSLLISDLWQTARATRDKRDNPKPFYVYMDEFQRFVTPPIAENLDEARGFGLHLTLVNQYPNQVVHAGGEGVGEHLRESLLANTTNKAVFRFESPPKDLEDLALWLFRGAFDPNQIKHELYATKAMGQHREMFTGSATTDGTIDTSATGLSIDPDDPDGEKRESTNEGHNATSNTSYQEHEGLVTDYGQELSSREYRSLDEQLAIAMQALHSQDDRFGVVRLAGMRSGMAFRTLTVDDPSVSKGRIAAHRVELLKATPEALLRSEADQLVQNQDQVLRQQLLSSQEEPSGPVVRSRKKP